MPSGPKSMRSLYAGLRASGKGSASRTRPTRLSPRSKPETPMTAAATNMPSVVCPTYAAHAERHANAISDRASLRLSRPCGDRPLINPGALDHGGIPRAPDRGALRPGALGTVARPGPGSGRGVALGRPGIDRLHQEHH